jgi:hypothetical protein
MHETKRLLEAAASLSSLLHNTGIPHAFHGSVLRAVVSDSEFSDASIFSPLEIILTDYPQEIFCIVESGKNQHPFRRVRDAISGNDDFTVTHSPWTDR